MKNDRVLTCASLLFACIAVYGIGYMAIQEHRTIQTQAQSIHTCTGILQALDMFAHPPKGASIKVAPVAPGNRSITTSGVFHI